MPRLTKSLQAWGTPDFEAVLKSEIQQLDPAWLPLQQGLARGSYALADGLSAMILGVRADAACLHVRAGIFYSGIIAGCSCADDPTPVDAQSEYCEVQLDIDRATAETTITLLTA